MPLNITTGDTPIKVERANVLIYGPPGHGKTSLAFSAHEPLLLDFDNGSHRSAFRRDAVIVKHWSDTSALTAADLKPYRTVIVDTVGRALDRLTVMLQEDNPKLRTRHGGLTLQGYGELKGAFTTWIRSLQVMGKDVVMVAHDKEDKRGDDVVLRADIQGGSYAEIFKLADAVGYLHIGDNNQRILNFNPSDYHTGKNPAGLGTVMVPDLHQEPEFLGTLIDSIKDGIGKIGAESQAIKKEVTKWRRKINKAGNAKALNALIDECKEIERRTVAVQAWKLIQTRAETTKSVYDKKAHTFSDPESEAGEDEAAQ